MWEFEAVRLATIKKIEALHLSSSRIIQLGRCYEVNDWIAPAVERLTLRPESLTSQELGQVGLDFAAKIYAFRDLKLRLALEVVKEHLAVQDIERMDHSISTHIRKQEIHDVSSLELPEDVSEETCVGSYTASEHGIATEGDDKETEVGSSLVGSKPILLNR